MLNPRPSFVRTCWGALMVLTLLAGCAGGPKYGAARKSRKGCDCPHWNAVPRQARGAALSGHHTAPPTVQHGVRN